MAALVFEQGLEEQPPVVIADAGAMPRGIAVQADQFLLERQVMLQQLLQTVAEPDRTQLRRAGRHAEGQHAGQLGLGGGARR